jgi:hypothetical protein
VYLSEADTVSDMVELFDAHDGWIAQSSIKASSPQPGDYLALKGSDGKRLGHSALVMAVSSDSRYIYTSEGNVNDCVKFMKRRFFTDGQLNSDINGLGKLQTFY